MSHVRERFRRSFSGRKVGVIGLAREGVALTKALSAEGAHVVVSDRAASSALAPALDAIRGCDVTLDLGGHHFDRLRGCEVVFVSAGVPRSLPVLLDLTREGVRLSSETEFFLVRCPVPVIGLTGSAGKTTTTTLVGNILAADGRHTMVGGNIGRPLIGSLGEIVPGTMVVLELSSFQLQHLSVSPHIATVLNVSPNHLDRHHDMDEYVEAKRQIVAHQTAGDIAVVNADDQRARAFASSTSAEAVHFSLSPLPIDVMGAFFDGAMLVAQTDGVRRPVLPRSELSLRGQHNVANAAAAIATTMAAGASVAAMKQALSTFRGVEHRLEVVGSHAGVTYVNDSIATAPERLIAGLEALESPIVLVAGGRDKHLPWDDAASLICHRVRAVVTLGEAASLIEAAIHKAGDGGSSPTLVRADDMRQAVHEATQLASPGDIVLLSPGCTSFDRYRDYEERGHDFKAVVMSMLQPEAAS